MATAADEDCQLTNDGRTRETSPDLFDYALQEQDPLSREIEEQSPREGTVEGGTACGSAVGWLVGQNEEKSAGQLQSFAHYMRLKKDKLLHQVNVISKPAEAVSNIFNGISIFVNGYTVPSSLQLRSLVHANGGEFHVYYEPGITTYTVATSLAHAKHAKTAAANHQRLIRPEFIVDCVAAGHLLDDTKYLLLEEKGRVATDPEFISQYYARSRLHLISTLAQEMKDYVAELRLKEARDENRDALREYLTLQNSARYEEDGEGRDIVPSPSISPSDPLIFHIDLDCFFVSVALRSRPSLVDRPVAVTHSSGSSTSNGFSEVASCSYAARAKGVRNGCLVRDALQKCPDLVCLPYQFDDYRHVSRAVYSIISSLTHSIRAVSCDEMYVDVSGLCCSQSALTPLQLADLIRDTILQKTGCPASIGAGPNALLARLATRFAKPDGVHWVAACNFNQFMSQQKVSDLPGVGYSIRERLCEAFGPMETCAELQRVREEQLQGLLGKKAGAQLYRACRGVDDSPITAAAAPRKSISCDINYGIRFSTQMDVDKFVSSLATHLEKKLTSARMLAGSLTLKVMVRAADAPLQTAKYLGHGKCSIQSKSTRLSPATSNADKLCSITGDLLRSVKASIEDLRGIGVQLGRLTSSQPQKTPPKNSLDKIFRRSMTAVRREEPTVEDEFSPEEAKEEEDSLAEAEDEEGCQLLDELVPEEEVDMEEREDEERMNSRIPIYQFRSLESIFSLAHLVDEEAPSFLRVTELTDACVTLLLDGHFSLLNSFLTRLHHATLRLNHPEAWILAIKCIIYQLEEMSAVEREAWAGKECKMKSPSLSMTPFSVGPSFNHCLFDPKHF